MFRSFVATTRISQLLAANSCSSRTQRLSTTARLFNDAKEEKDKDKDPSPVQPSDNTTNEEEEVKTLSLKLKEVQAAYLLALADQENLRQRSVRDVANTREFAIQKFAKDLLDSMDILTMALDSVPQGFRTKDECLEQDKEALAQQLTDLYTGVSMTKTELQKTLERYDVRQDDPIDQPFDPNKHEAVFQAPVPDKEPGTIFVVQKKGYLLKNRVLRPAQVGVVAEK